MKNNPIPSSYHEAKDRCPSCGSYVNIDTDLDENDFCNECRDGSDEISTENCIENPNGISVMELKIHLDYLIDQGLGDMKIFIDSEDFYKLTECQFTKSGINLV